LGSLVVNRSGRVACGVAGVLVVRHARRRAVGAAGRTCDGPASFPAWIGSQPGHGGTAPDRRSCPVRCLDLGVGRCGRAGRDSLQGVSHRAVARLVSARACFANRGLPLVLCRWRRGRRALCNGAGCRGCISPTARCPPASLRRHHCLLRWQHGSVPASLAAVVPAPRRPIHYGRAPTPCPLAVFPFFGPCLECSRPSGRRHRRDARDDGGNRNDSSLSCCWGGGACSLVALKNDNPRPELLRFLGIVIRATVEYKVPSHVLDSAARS